MSFLLKILGASFFSQFILIAISPILTRIYDPSIFGMLLIFTSLLYIINSYSLFRMDILILKLEEIADVDIAFNFGLVISLFLFVINTIILFILFNIFDFNWVYLLLPIMVIFLSINQLILSYYIRSDKANIIMRNKIGQSIILAFGQISFGFIFPSIFSIVFSQIISYLVVNIYNLKCIVVNPLIVLNNIKFLRKFFKDSFFDTISNFFQVFLNNISPILIFSIFGPYWGGIYYMAYRILVFPVTIFSNSISSMLGNIYLKEIDYKGKNNYILELITLIFVLPFSILSLISDKLFIYIFGSEWGDSGKLVMYFSTWIFLKLIVDSFLVNWALFNKSNIKFIIEIINFVVVGSFFIFSCFYKLEAIEFFRYYSFINIGICAFGIFCMSIFLNVFKFNSIFTLFISTVFILMTKFIFEFYLFIYLLFVFYFVFSWLVFFKNYRAKGLNHE